MRAQCLRGHLVMDACSGAASVPVRVSYFDPRTGEPCDSKPEPLSERVQTRRIRELEGYRASLDRGRRCRPVLVDGVLFESINAAARGMGVSKCGLGEALRNGLGSYGGREVRFADGSTGCVRRAAKPKGPAKSSVHNARPVVVDGVRYARLKDAAEAVGCTGPTLCNALRHGQGRVKGREVAYA